MARLPSLNRHHLIVGSLTKMQLHAYDSIISSNASVTNLTPSIWRRY